MTVVQYIYSNAFEFAAWARPSTLPGSSSSSFIRTYDLALKLNLITRHLRLQFERGRLIEIGTYTPEHFYDGDILLPDLTILHVLFRYRTIAELEHVLRDCFAANAAGEVLLNALFPKESTFISAFP
ncbi:MAG: hypothetical protein R2851_04910 [Caldilineaceae bacterium]